MDAIEEALEFDRAVDYHYGAFPPKDLDLKLLIGPLTEAVDAIARFDQILRILPNRDILLARLRNQEAVISSRIEGTISTIDEILRYEAEFDNDDDAAAGVRSDVIETILYQRAMKQAQEAMEDGRPLSEWLIRSLHEVLLSFGRGAEKNPGQYKTKQNYLVDRTKRNVLFIPISPVRLHEGMLRLIEYIDTSKDPALLKAAISHVEFEALHPFDDGNGRTGRMLITLLLWREKHISSPHFYISGYLDEHKDEYIDLMRAVSSVGAWDEWCLFFLRALTAQARRNLHMGERIRDLYTESLAAFTGLFSSKWSTVATDFVFERPIFQISQMSNRTAIGDATARRFVKLLEERGHLACIEPAAGRRPALYAFEPLLKLVRV
ncbi:MAG: Fic/DOC family N-terminal domain-containing protein [Pseudomonadota bacterium]